MDCVSLGLSIGLRQVGWDQASACRNCVLEYVLKRLDGKLWKDTVHAHCYYQQPRYIRAFL